MTAAQTWRGNGQHGESSRTWKLGRGNIRTKEQVIRKRSTARRENRHLRRGSILKNTTTSEAVKVNGA